MMEMNKRRENTGGRSHRKESTNKPKQNKTKQNNPKQTSKSNCNCNCNCDQQIFNLGMDKLWVHWVR